MSMIDRSLDGMAFLSGQLGSIVRRRLREVGGIALISFAMLAALALATWSVNDPSLSHATDAPVHNLLGRPGAAAADLLMQLVGLGSLALILPVGIWGYRLLGHRPLRRERLRLVLWLLGAVLAAAFASSLPRGTHWPLPSGLGGVVGDAMLRLPVVLLGIPLAGTYRMAASIALGVAALVTFACTAGLVLAGSAAAEDEEDDEPAEASNDDDGRWISLGRLMHFVLSVRTRMSLIFRRAGRSPGEQRAVPAARRIEPRFDGRPDHRTAEEADDELAGAPAPRAPRKPRPPKPRRSSSGYVLPPLELLAQPSKVGRASVSSDMLQENAAALESVLADFGVRGEIINARPGPVVTLYELEPAPGIKSSRVISLADDIARSMSALSARVAVVSGRNAIGIELPNPNREKVYLRELLASHDYADTTARLPLCLGKAIGGEPILVDLARMPHLLIAGTTGSGKSVAINTMILSLLYRLQPDQCRLIMVDPKMLELSVYDGIPHLLTPVVTDPKKAVVALKWAVREMEERYKKMSKLGVRNIDGYNARVVEANAKGEKLARTVHTGYNRETGEAIYEKEELDLEPLPYIVVIVDEMADLMMVAGKDIEGAVQRLAQMARAAGLHVILATQRPSVDVITGTIKANFPTRISFQVTSKIDSRTILGEQGAEQLLGQGDMLYMAGGGRISRVHGPFVSDGEVEKAVRHLKAQGVPEYLEAVTAEDPEEDGQAVFDSTAMGASEGGDLFQQAVQVVTRDRKASTSYIQRRLQIGYNRAASLMERMEAEGIVGQANHAGKREILVEAAEDDRY
ncbi:MAG: DNA translocase FtsK 4TM domain-containing protein [Hyphomicrobiales bacterium]|nr:DNA translocase FtsK 4TM domain-containing protein [Hyphomicrobiales bacterium]MDE1972858.1 DNA translocase FtsK 4TM domain-containing protein [Hyphomicrobiales bacterium]